MRSRFFIAVLCVFAAAHAQSLKVVPVQLDAHNQNGLPGSIQFFCTEDYPHQACLDDVEKLHRGLLRYPVEQLGQWIFVLATRNQAIAVQHRPDGSPETPAFTFINHRTTVMERDLFSATADRSSELFRAFGLSGSDLLELAISHELGHALCHEPDEHRADDYGRELRCGRIPSCSLSPGLSATRSQSRWRPSACICSAK
jgi:hypothetical protein